MTVKKKKTLIVGRPTCVQICSLWLILHDTKYGFDNGAIPCITLFHTIMVFDLYEVNVLIK